MFNLFKKILNVKHDSLEVPQMLKGKDPEPKET
ncbi:hypothetical protein J2Z32_002854 [Paenibacillus turicensis]|uniref:Uncharacterized protein n=1 Tax=Paenibacillus turicensis TaxID=160487 RepID=A0ABS4FUJ6_9BACL|nr:hypothetical protein [Paenibacillus turicensis]